MNQVKTEEVLKKILRYVLEGLVIAVCSKLIPGNKFEVKHIMMMTMLITVIFMLLDVFSSDTLTSVRWGVGIGLGYGIVGMYTLVVNKDKLVSDE